MSNMLQRGATWLGQKLQLAGGRAVVYSRGTRSVGITATPQMHKETVLDKQTGLPIEVVIYSWTVTASDIVLSGVQEKPRDGDTISETLNGETIKWTVLPIDENRKAVEWLDSSGLLLLVHSKRVE